MAQENENVGDWDDYLGGTFLKADQVGSVDDVFMVKEVEEYLDNREGNDIRVVRLTLDKGNSEYLFDLNKTNASFIRSKNVNHPKDLKGMKLQFQKVKVTNPRTKKEVDGLRVFNIF